MDSILAVALMVVMAYVFCRILQAAEALCKAAFLDWYTKHVIKMLRELLTEQDVEVLSMDREADTIRGVLRYNKTIKAFSTEFRYAMSAESRTVLIDKVLTSLYPNHKRKAISA